MAKQNDPSLNDVDTIADDGGAPDAEAPPPLGSKYEVGYGKPPKRTQWKPGQSGNPKGKKKGLKSVKQLFLYQPA